MNINVTRGLTLAVLTGGMTVLGATAANAVELPDLGLGGSESGGLLGNGGLLGTGIDLGGVTDGVTGDGSLIDDLLVDVPVVVDGLNLSVLGTNSDSLALGDGVTLDTGVTHADILSSLGIDTTSLIGENNLQNAIVGVPLDVSNTWLSLFGNEPNGLVIVPEVHGGPAGLLDGVADGIVDVPVDISCTSVTVLSSYQNECASTLGGEGTTDGGVLDGLLDGALGDVLGGDVLGGDLLGGDPLGADLPLGLTDVDLGVLDGSTLGGAPALGDGMLIDPTDDVIDLSQTIGLGDTFADVGAPLDLSKVWVSALGNDRRNGVVVVPDLTLDLSAVTGGLVSSEVLAPIVIDCVTITVLSDYERDCAAGPTDPTDPTDPENPVDPENPGNPGEPGDGGDGENNGGDNGDNGITDPCAVVPTSATTTLASGADSLMIAAAAIAGALVAFALMLLGRRFGAQH